jgi:putative acetyltransferase
MSLEIFPADTTAPDVRHLIEAHLEFGHTSYPNESCHHLTLEQYQTDDLLLFAAREGEVCLGILGLMKLDATSAEVKSMHVHDRARGRGIGMALVAYIIKHAEQTEIETLYLGTGSRDASAPARRLYERAGFSKCAPFGTHVSSPESVFMSLEIRTTA